MSSNLPSNIACLSAFSEDVSGAPSALRAKIFFSVVLAGLITFSKPVRSTLVVGSSGGRGPCCVILFFGNVAACVFAAVSGASVLLLAAAIAL